MTRGIRGLADRMVARLVPTVRAGAISCSSDYRGACWVRTCCTGAEVPGGVYCSGFYYYCG
ncbi:hypothetical protein JOL79_09805 [Microbispora sp. RL4-1S]|uniref:Uncharacterized protein n=1 Tax=Microbispora oryzae TaxID=2806554 RepID=A0A940WJN9_9ACTN|nr:hypothetical protein [Microbispora oryzae]MBP2704103.1 hypothetical protein [Microbispora oryzae]